MILLICLLIFSFSLVRASDELPCSNYQSVNITGALITPNGSAIFEGQEYLNGTYGYFKDSIFENLASNITNNETEHLRGCFCLLKGAKPCLNFCCPPGYLKKNKFEDDCYPYIFEVFVNTSNKEDRKEIRANDEYTIVQSDYCDNFFYVREPHQWSLLENGILQMESYDHNIYTHRHGNYCIDPTLMEDLTIHNRISLCYKSDMTFNEVGFKIRYEFAGLIFSIIFLILTLSIYILVPEFRNLRGKILMCYMAAVMVFFCCLALMYSNYSTTLEFSCLLTGVLRFGSGLVAIFFWNGLNIDYFTTFYLKEFRRENKSKLFRWYVLYSFGCAFIIIFIAAILDSVGSEPEVVNSEPKATKCHIQNEMHFFCGVVFLTLIVNIVLEMSIKKEVGVKRLSEILHTHNKYESRIKHIEFTLN